MTSGTRRQMGLKCEERIEEQVTERRPGHKHYRAFVCWSQSQTFIPLLTLYIWYPHSSGLPSPGSTHISKYLNNKESCPRRVKRVVLPIRLETKVFGDLKSSKIICKSQPLSSLTHSAVWNIHI